MNVWRWPRATFGFLGTCGPLVVSAQNRTPVADCVFDTPAHRDTIVIAWSIFVRNGADSLADPALTRAIGGTARGRAVTSSRDHSLLGRESSRNPLLRASREATARNARNDSTAPVASTSTRVTKCINVRGPSEPFVPGTLVLAPGATANVRLT